MHCLTLTLAAIAPVTFPQDTATVDTIIRMPEVVVSATRSADGKRLDQPLALSLLEPSVAEIGRGTVAADLLRDLPGVHIQQTSAGQGTVVLRGLIGNQVLLLVDGIPLNNGTYRDGPGQYLATIDPETIERIEVIRGPASVLYGSDAQGGVVNVVTRSHPFLGPRSVSASGKASSANAGYRGRFSAGLQGSRLSVAVGGSLGTAGDLRAGGNIGAQQPTGFDVAGLDAGISFRPDHQHEIRGGVQYFRMSDVPRYDRYVDFRAPAPGVDFEHTFDPQARQLVFARYVLTPEVGAVTRFEATASLAVQREGRNRIRLLAPTVADSIRTHWRDDVFTPGVSLVGNSMVSLIDRPLAITWGGDFYYDRLRSEGWEENLESGASVALFRQTNSGTVQTGRFPNGANAHRLGLFLSSEYNPIAAIRLSLGLRWSNFRNQADVGTDFGGQVENSSSDITAQVGLVAIPAARWRVAFRLAEGFRAPNLYDLTNVGPVPGGVVLPNPDAEPERSLSAEVSVRYSEDNGAFDLTVYRTSISDFIDRTEGVFQGDTLFNGERIFQGTNVGSADLVGFEAEGVLRFGPVESRGTVLYTRGDQEGATGVDEPMSKIPPLSGTASVRWRSRDRRLWVEYALRWAARQDRLGSRDLRDPRIAEGGTPGFAVHGVVAGARLAPHITVSGGFENLTDELYRNHASGVDNAGRHLWVGVSAVGMF